MNLVSFPWGVTRSDLCSVFNKAEGLVFLMNYEKKKDESGKLPIATSNLYARLASKWNKSTFLQKIKSHSLFNSFTFSQ